MSLLQVKEFFKNINLEDRIVEHKEVSDTVENAAAVIGCMPKEIAKTMSFLIGEEPILITVSGDAKIDNSKYKSYFNQKAVMIPFNKVEELVGHNPGGICPFAVNENVKTYLDISLKRFDIVYTGAGNASSTVKVSIDELEKHSNSIDWIDVCKNWNSED